MSRLDELIAELCPDGVEYRLLAELEDAKLIKLGRGNVISKKEIREIPGNYPVYSSSAVGNGEIGSYGKDTQGILRVHEVMKIEQVVLCINDKEESVRLHEEITRNAEEILQGLNIHYHIVVTCTGDEGLGQVKINIGTDRIFFQIDIRIKRICPVNLQNAIVM